MMDQIVKATPIQ